MDSTIIAAIIGAVVAIVTAAIGAWNNIVKGRENREIRQEWEKYKAAASKHAAYVDVDYGIRIVSPASGTNVGEWVEVTGRYDVMPPPQTLRLFTVWRGTSSYGEHHWPQQIVTDFSTDTGIWRAKVHIGDEPSGEMTGIIAAVVGPSSIVLWNYYYKVGPTIGWWDFEGWPADSKVQDRIDVKRV